MARTVSGAEAVFPGICRACGYPLRGLGAQRCPECGRSFDLHDPRSYRIPGEWAAAMARLARRAEDFAIRRAQAIWAATRYECVIALAIFAYAWWSGDLALMVIPVLLLWTLGRRFWKTAAFIVLASPLFLHLIAAMWNYTSTGSDFNARSRQVLIAPVGSIDPITRCYRRDNGGCGCRSSDYLTREYAHGLAERIMAPLIGAPAGAYTGPYPTEAEAIAAVRAGIVQDQKLSQYGTVRVGSIEFRAAAAYNWQRTDYQTEEAKQRIAAHPELARMEPVLASIVGGRCLIIRAPQFCVAEQQPARVELIDVTNGNQFAMYEDPDPLPPTVVFP